MEMQNIKLNQYINLKKGIATAKKRIAKGLEGKKLGYALRYIKGAKTKMRKIKNEIGKIKMAVTKIKMAVTKIKMAKNKNESAKIKMAKNKNESAKIKMAIYKIVSKLKNKIEEAKKERDFIKRWEDLEEWDKWKEWNE